jgi:Secretory lipase
VRRVVRLGVVLACLATLFAACGHEPPDGPAQSRGPALDGDFSGSGPGTLLAAEALLTVSPHLRSITSLAARITYVSTSGINDSHSVVTATVFVPNGSPPEGGWRIVALGHPATGIEADCAPSDSPTLLGQAPKVVSLVEAGYMVTMTDYQGLGLRPSDTPPGDEDAQKFNDYHPFLDSATEGYNVIDSVRAARKLVPAASDSFAIWGTGQGGQAAWAANELATDYRGVLKLVGTVVVSPTAALEWLADAAASGNLTHDQVMLLQQFLASLKITYDDFDLDAFRHGVAKDNWDALSACRGPATADRDRIAAQLVPGDLRPDGPDATEALRAFLQKTSLPQAPTAAPMLIVPAQDGLIPQHQTDAAVARACAMGDVIQIGTPQDSAQSLIEWIDRRFDGADPQNDCTNPAAPSPQEPTG